jgi:hypothetical protein
MAESNKTPACNARMGALGSKNPPINLYDPAMLATVEHAFDSTWVVLQARYPFRDFERDSDLRTALSQKLLTLAAEGVTDPVELREWALEGPLLR